MALELVSGASLGCVLHYFSTLTHWRGSRGQVWPESGRKSPKLRFYFLVLGLIAVADLWKVFYIENWRFDLGSLRVANRSPTQILKSKDFLGPFDDIWGARGPHFRPIWGVPGVRAGLTNTYVLAL